MKGTLYIIGVGPGDPELMTIKAVRRIQACAVLGIPHKDKTRCIAYRIAVQAVPEMEDKELLCVDMPMTKDPELLLKSHKAGAKLLAQKLSEGTDVAFLTLGDATVYASSTYLMEGIEQLGYEAQLINGIPSFCAAAAKLNAALVRNTEELHILPASYQIEEGLKLPGVKILMKAGRSFTEVKRLLEQGNYQVSMVENCGMPEERVYTQLEDIPEWAGYYSLFIVRDGD